MMKEECWSEAQSTLETQLELLHQLEQSLKAKGLPISSISPLAGARYQLGLCYEKVGCQADALHQLYNVYIQYGDSEWGPQAQEEAQRLIDEFKAQGKTVKIDSGTEYIDAEKTAFRVAHRLFSERQYAHAVSAYLDAVNRYPEGAEAIPALRELALCAVYLDDSLQAKTFVRYLAERFADQSAGGDALLAVGKTAMDENNETLAWWIYDCYIAAYPLHPKVPQVLYSLAELRDEDDYLTRIIKKYPNSVYCIRALGLLAWNAFEKKEYPTASEWFSLYAERETDPEKQTRACFALAESFRFSKAWGSALRHFQSLETDLTRATEKFGISEETLERNRSFLEKSVCHQAVCQEKLSEPNVAVQTCDHFIAAFPQSELAPQVRFTKARILIENNRFAEALIVLEFFNEHTER
jgi:outer membrane protein assembly factor BamD (BamD/ComL family)